MSSLSIEQERELITEAQHDPEQFTALYELYMPQIYRYLVSRIGDRQLAEDITSQTFLRAVEKLHTFKFDGKPFGAWLFRIAHNQLVDHIRKHAKHVQVPLNAAQEISSNDDPHANAHTTHLYEKIKSLLSELSDQEQEVLLLKITSGLTFREIATIVGKKENSVKTMYFRSLKALKAKVDLVVVLLLLLSTP